MPHAVHWKSTLPSRKSRNRGEWLSRQLLAVLCPRSACLNSSLGLLDAEEVLLVGRLLVGVGGRDHHGVDLEVVVEEVEHVAHRLGRVGVEERRVGRDPEALLPWPARMAATALSKTPSRSTAASWRSRKPVDVDDPGEVVRRGEPVEPPLEEHGVGAQVDVDLAEMSSSTIASMSGCSSGSPPAMETMGVPDSSTASRRPRPRGAGAGSRSGAGSCRSPGRRGCRRTAARSRR